MPVVALSTLLQAQVDQGATLPPFIARLKMDVALFTASDTEPIATREVSAVVAYSNAWWQIDTRHRNNIGQDIYGSYMRVPDGVRFINVSPEMAALVTDSNVIVAADACPLPFPPPADLDAFVLWMSMCPNPELPVTSDGRIYRFTDSGPCPIDLFNDPKSIGTYGLEFLDATKGFISSLRITNNGVRIDASPTADGSWEVEYTPHPAPFDRGFVEFIYEVLETTNHNGHRVPLRAVAKRIFAISDPPRLYEGAICNVDLLSIEGLNPEAAAGLTRAERLLVKDLRPPALPNPITYLITNEAWKGTSAPAIALAAKTVRELKPERPAGSMVAKALFIVALILPPLLYLLIFKGRRA